MSKTHTLLRTALPAIAGAVGLAFAAAGPGALAQEATKPLVHAIPYDVNSIDPADSRGSVDQEIMLNIYERLVRILCEDWGLIRDSSSQAA